MFKAAHHPKAFLTLKKNVRRGLRARTKIVLVLERMASHARRVSEETGLSYSSVVHHLRLLEAEKVLTRKGERPYFWELTGAGQQRLMDADGKK